VDESVEAFSSRKRDHLRLALSKEVQAEGQSCFEKIRLQHNALPELDLARVSLATSTLGLQMRTPFLISSMTAGHLDSVNLNVRLASAAQARGWLMGVGSQRRELKDPEASKEWVSLRRVAPDARLLANVGLSQIIETDPDSVLRLVDSLGAVALIVHLNPLQEALQLEGTPKFGGGLRAIESLVKRLGQTPIVVKETGCGISEQVAEKLFSVGVTALDVSGFGGTHWGRVEGARSQTASGAEAQMKAQASQVFRNWGLSTVESLIACQRVPRKNHQEIWSSGGVRSGLDAVKSLVLGARVVGFAQPILSAALVSEDKLDELMSQIEFEARVALFCLGQADLNGIEMKGLWAW